MVNSVGDVFSRRLPSLIRVAQQRAQELPEVHAIRQGPVLVRALLAFTNLDAVDAPLRFSRGKLASILGVTTRTIDRRLGELEKAGFAERATPKGKVAGRWPVCHVRWTAAALLAFWPHGRPRAASARLAGAPPGPSAAPGPSPLGAVGHPCGRPRLPATGLSHRSSRENLGTRESGEPGFAGTALPQAPPPSPALRRIPGDLRMLATDHALRPEQICTLMARCKQRRQRLQDVLAMAGAALVGRRGDGAMGFLLHLVSLDRDYAASRLRQDTRQSRSARQARRARREHALLAGVAVGAVVPGLGHVVDRGTDHLVVEQAGVRCVADPAAVARAVGRGTGWRGLLRVRRGQLEHRHGPAEATPGDRPRPEPGAAGVGQGRAAAVQLAALVRTLRVGAGSGTKRNAQPSRLQIAADLLVGSGAVAMQAGD